MIKEAIEKVVKKMDLTQHEAELVMAEIMTGEALPTQISSLITALRMKGETVEEISGFAKIMQSKSTHINTKRKFLIDTCGTGGDKSNTFNISTVTAFVSAGAGINIAKHGNRSVSSKCGSADLLEELGVDIEAKVHIVEKCLDEIGIAFLFAPLLHTAMKYAIGPRKEIGIRTVFNVLGPLTNPAGAQAQILGVYEKKLTKIMANVLGTLGCKEAWVVHGEDGLDEVTTTTFTNVSRWRNSKVEEIKITPEDYGINLTSKENLLGGDKTTNAKIIKDILDGKKGPQRDIVVINSAIAIVCGGIAKDLKEGIKLACESIDSGKAKNKLEDLIRITNGR